MKMKQLNLLMQKNLRNSIKNDFTLKRMENLNSQTLIYLKKERIKIKNIKREKIKIIKRIINFRRRISIKFNGTRIIIQI